MSAATLTSPRARQALKVRGVVQGVGFRPAVYRLAVEQGLAGFVRNDPDGVTIEIEGDAGPVSQFADLLRSRAPRPSRIDEIVIRSAEVQAERRFRVETSSTASIEKRADVPADRATCDECVRELFDPQNRRYLYPFITCTDCGPRFTIVRELPYDRSRTTMSSFEMCAACRAEYDDPLERRFHSETNSCPRCGPRLATPVGESIARLRAGEIVAVKGLGGFHLAVDAMNEHAVARLREKKRRPHKPFAVMARDLDVASRFVDIDAAAREAVAGASRPIVCLPKRSDLAPSVAPGLSEIGVMLPYTPLHHLLFAGGPDVLVMTSGNQTDEPIAIENDEATARLGGIADAFLLHDRPIHARADDSVIRIVASEPQPVRRSRGVVPESVPLPFDAPAVLATGGELKNTICVTRGRAAYLSQHIGDLSHPRSLSFFEELVRQNDVVAVAHDLHPDYHSTRWALRSGLRTVAVQHHHAHIASCMAENGRTGPLIGVAFDGTGCGPSGELWGGEFLICDLESFRRAGHVRAIALPGGEAAIREPWRLAVAAQLDAGVAVPETNRRRLVAQMIQQRVNAPDATSVGRWFDAVAALCGLRETITFEGQAAMELEAIAGPDSDPYPFEIGDDGEIDLRPMIRAIAAGHELASMVASRFHETLAQAVAAMSAGLRSAGNIDTVALSGGCFQNRRLTERVKELLEKRGFDVLLHRRVPPNDGGIALGQAAVAAFRLRGEAN